MCWRNAASGKRADFTPTSSIALPTSSVPDRKCCANSPARRSDQPGFVFVPARKNNALTRSPEPPQEAGMRIP